MHMHMHAHMHMHMYMHMRIVYVCTYTALSFMLSVHVTLHTELELIRITPCVPWSHALLKPYLPVSPWDTNTPLGSIPAYAIGGARAAWAQLRPSPRHSSYQDGLHISRLL